MSDPQNPEILEFVKPSIEELAARKKRNVAIALGLLGFITLVFLVMITQLGFFK